MITLKARADWQGTQTQSTIRLAGARVIIGAIAIAFLASIVAAQRAQAQTLSTLHGFAGYPDDGANPQSEMIVDSSGNLFGTTENGGSSDVGTVFELDTSGVLTVLYSFAGSPNDGAYPVAGLVRDSSGNLYGTTRGGGPSGNGIVFKLDTSGNLTLLHEFTGSPEDGAHPYAGLILDASSDYLYGTTKDGGSNNLGTVFKLDTSGNNFALLHNFAGYQNDGANPYGGLVMDSSDNLYGTTYDGGLHNLGTVFKLDTSGNNFTVVHNFAGYMGDGAYPYGDLIMDASSSLYGTTGSGGSSNNGTVFKVEASSSNFVLLYSFAINEGVIPEAGLVLDTSNNRLYGTTSLAGSSVGGTVFELDTSGGSFAVLHNFTGSPNDGANSYAALVMDSLGNLYGTSSNGGSYSLGTVFEISMTRKKTTIQDISNQVNSLCSQGALNKGQANSLVKKLEHASKRIDAGNADPAIGILESFINEVNALLNSRRLTSEQGAELINAANGMIEQLQAM